MTRLRATRGDGGRHHEHEEKAGRAPWGRKSKESEGKGMARNGNNEPETVVKDGDDTTPLQCVATSRRRVQRRRRRRSSVDRGFGDAGHEHHAAW